MNVKRNTQMINLFKLLEKIKKIRAINELMHVLCVLI
jgi:hypothetical protein